MHPLNIRIGSVKARCLARRYCRGLVFHVRTKLQYVELKGMQRK